MSTPKYTIEPRGKSWAIIKWEYKKNGNIGTNIESYATKFHAIQALDLIIRAENKDKQKV